MKKITAIFLILCMVFSLCSLSACAESANNDSAENAADKTLVLQIDNPMMTVNGEEKEIDPGLGTVPLIRNGRTLVPIRAIIEEMGGSVSWNEETQTASLEYKSDIISLTIGSTNAYLNEKLNTLDTAPIVINERTMLPIRFIAESFKFNVDWNEETQTVTITKAPDTSGNTATEPSEEKKVLVVYYSATGSTKKAAEYIAEKTNADIFELEPVDPYTSNDLDWTDDNSRVVREHDNEEERNVQLKTTSVPEWETYDTVFIGYPIWWGIAAWPVNGFVNGNDFTGKTVIPFCTSASSGLGDSGKILAETAGTGNWLEGKRFSSGASENDISKWLEELKY